MWLINWVATVVAVALCVLLVITIAGLVIAAGVVALLWLLVTGAALYCLTGAVMLIRKPDSWNERLRQAGY